jgi:hypothetical protein
MPNTPNRQTQYIHAGDPDSDNRSTLYAPGELGMVLQANDKTYQRVVLDSGATAATGTGVVTANDLAFWKAKGPDYIVTNDQAQAIGAGVTNAWRNQVAGVFRAPITAGNYCYVLQRGDAIPVNATGGGMGQTAIANSGSDADVTFEAVGTQATYNPLGIAIEATGDTTAGMCNVDLNIPSIP